MGGKTVEAGVHRHDESQGRGPGRVTGLLLLLCTCVMVGPALASNAPRQRVRVGRNEGPGIQVARKDVLFGNPRTAKKPGVVDMSRALAATPEGRQVADEGVEKGSAKYSILMAKAHARVRKIVKRVAVRSDCDCVVKTGSIKKNPQNLPITDLTELVVAALG